MVNRRKFIRNTLGASLGAPFALSFYGCASPLYDRLDASTGLSLGCVVGEVTADGAMVWLRGVAGSQVRMQHWKDKVTAGMVSSAPVGVKSESDFTTVFTLRGLEPRTTYYYRALVEGKKPGPIGRFVTAPAAADPSRVSFCFSGDTRESYQPFTIMGAIEAQQPDFFLHLGDTVYADRGGRARHLAEFWQKHRANRSDPFFQRLFAQTSVYAVWDDHEVEDNYLPDNPLAPIGEKAFLDYWPVRPIAHPRGGIQRSFRWGKSAELFILDTRRQRNIAKKTLLGKDQKEWLLNGLVSSDALVRFIATSVPMYGGGRDRWDGFPKEREQLLSYIAEKRLPVVFLSADMHYAAVSQIPNGRGLKEITAGPLAAPMNVITNGTASRFEFFSNATFNFAKLTVDAKLHPSQVLVEFYDRDNRRFHQTMIDVA